MISSKFCITSCNEFVGRSQKTKRLNSVFSSYLNSACSSLSFAGRFNFAAFTPPHSTASCWMSTPISVKVNALSTVGALNNELEASSRWIIGANDLLIVGPGVLGRIVAEKWQKENPGSQIYGQTLTSNHHDELIKMGIIPSLKGTRVTHKFPNVIFCAPPSRSPDYPGEVREATLNWNGEGSFLFTSSSAPYDCHDNGPCDEYKADRGAHTYWLKKGSVDIRPDHILNLIHYEDAASLSITILKKKLRSRIFLGCDNNPLSRQEVMELVSKSGKSSKRFEGFTGTMDPLGKKLNNSKTRAELGWEPKYPSFAQFLESLE